MSAKIPDALYIYTHEQGNMVKKLKNHIPDAFPGFNACHELRCQIKTVHAYNKTSGKLNKALKSPFLERDKLKRKLTIADEKILEYIAESHC